MAQDSNGTQASALSKDQRIDAYLSLVKQLKERSALRDIMERELLLEAIRANQKAINEYPLLPKQQESIADFLTRRAADQPGGAFIGELSGRFLQAITRLIKALAVEDEEESGKARVEALNLETVLLKCAQGVVYATGLVVDNVGEVLVRYYGAEALDGIDVILENHELGETFWRKHVDQFVGTQVEDAYDEMIAGRRYRVEQRASFLALAFSFDDILGRLTKTSKKIEKTRIQAAFENETITEEARAVADTVRKYLQSRHEFLGQEPPEERVAVFLARVASMDHCAADYADLRRKAHENPAEAMSEEAREESEFVLEQVKGLVSGASVALHLVRYDFFRVVDSYSGKEAQRLLSQSGIFEIDALERVFFALLQARFVSLLRDKAEPHGAKVRVGSVQHRRVPVAGVEGLYENGLNRIREKKLFKQDDDREDTRLFVPTSKEKLLELLRLMQLEEELAKAVLGLWLQALPKVEIVAMINLALVSKTTTNVKQRLAEILMDFGIGAPPKPKPEPEAPVDAAKPAESADSVESQEGPSGSEQETPSGEAPAPEGVADA